MGADGCLGGLDPGTDRDEEKSIMLTTNVQITGMASASELDLQLGNCFAH